MSAYRDALHISLAEAGPRLALAADLLAQSTAVVVLADRLALRPFDDRILCEVISASAIDERTYESEVSEAEHMLSQSTLKDLLPGRPLEWLVVADYGSGTVELWRKAHQ